MSGGPIEKFTEGWAVKITGWGKAHYWKRDGVGYATTLCSTYGLLPVAFLRGAGSFTKCRACQKKAPSPFSARPPSNGETP